MDQVDARVGAIATRQLGLVTLAQCGEAGLSRHQANRRVRSGRWRRVHPGVFAIVGAEVTLAQRALAAVLAAGPTAVASHSTAARLHGLAYIPPHSGIEITVTDRHRRDLDGVLVHRSRVLPDADRTTVSGVPATSVARTLVDCGAGLSLGQMASSLDGALVQRQTTVRVVRTTRERLRPAPGRRVRDLDRLLAERGPESDRQESRREGWLYRTIVAAGFPSPVPQHWVTVRGERFRLDFAYPDIKLGIEYLGFDPHTTRTAFDRDFRRDRLLKTVGWEVIYFTGASDERDVRESLAPFVG